MELPIQSYDALGNIAYERDAKEAIQVTINTMD